MLDSRSTLKLRDLILSGGRFDWILPVTKRKSPPWMRFSRWQNNWKVIIFDDSDYAWAEENAAKVNSECMLFLQPE
ncbi:MAG: hypothetical protein IPH88_19350 [Bacteroidales bacterium]|nr:hypothetical protein [Bacteroidales bacterium]